MNKQYSYKNPLVEGADPFILFENGIFYLYSTYSKDGVAVRTSTNLKDWKDEGLALRKEDTYASINFWAPEIVHVNDEYIMVFSGAEHVGIAKSKSPLGPFKQTKKAPIDKDNMIDGSIFIDDDGNHYLYYVRFNHGNLVCAAKLSSDFESIDLSTERVIVEAKENWELQNENLCNDPICEGPFMLKHNSKYYLVYSCNHFMSTHYSLGYAVADNPLGPFIKAKENPILSLTDKVHGVGHNSFFKLDDKLICVYHSHKNLNEVTPRNVCIDIAEFIDDKLIIYGPTADTITIK